MNTIQNYIQQNKERFINELIDLLKIPSVSADKAYKNDVVKTAEEVIEYSGAFIQIYREEARYLDRTVHWIERVGLEYVKRRVLEDAEGRKAAFDRLMYALQGATDPWAERAKNREEHKQYETITI